jgi:uncharacterized protein YjbJ (UPF0337 family)
MNWDQVEGRWKQYKGLAKEKWGKITDDDFDVIDGKRQQLVGKIQERYGVTREAAETQADEFAKALNSETGDENKINRDAYRAGRGR